MNPGARIVVLGKQGAGKGTQAVRLSRHYVVPHVATGDIFAPPSAPAPRSAARLVNISTPAIWCPTMW